MVDTNDTNPASPKTILYATVAALGVAAVVLVTAILPAEYGIDPLGVGDATGLTVLSKGENPVEEQLIVHREDYVEFVLEAFQSVEYKYLMDIDAPMVFSWVADGELYYDMHAEPSGLGEEYAESYEQGNADSQMGSLHGRFTGIHGWFWENRGLDTVVVKLYSAGFYVNSTVFADGGSFEKQIQPVIQ